MNNKRKELLIVMALFALLVAVSILTSTDNGADGPLYSAFSTHENGTSLLYDTLKHMGYPAKISTKRLHGEVGLNDIYLIAQPDPEHLNPDELSEILHWVYRGGRLIYLETESPTSLEWMFNGMPIMSDGSYTLYRLGMGEVLTGSCQGLLNQTLLTDRRAGKLIQSTLDGWGYENVYFAEYYHGFQDQERAGDNLWNQLPSSLKILLLQLLIVIALVLWLLGKRFGKPVPYYEELEREENEYLVTLSSVYQNAGLGSLVLRFYYEHFIRQSAAYFKVSPDYTAQNIEMLWHDNDMPCTHHLADILSTVRNDKINTKRAADRRKFMQMLETIHILCGCIRLYNKETKNAG